MFDDEDRDCGPVATPLEAVREWANNVGATDRYKDRMWLLHDYDVWVRNPWYSGPVQTHPDDHEDY